MTQPRVYKAEGIILKRKNVGEADRILTIFTREHGKVRVIAKGIRKVSSRRAPHLEVFTRVRILVHQGKTMESVSEVEPQDVYKVLRQDLKRISIAYYLCELIDSITPEKQEHSDVYTLLQHALETLDTGEIGAIYRQSKIFTLELLWILGFLPRNQMLNGEKLALFVETITERRLKSVSFARLLMHE